MKRRSLLLGTASFTLAHLLASCRSASLPSLRVLFLEGSLPSQLPDRFQDNLTQPATLNFVPKAQLADLADLLQRWHADPPSQDGNQAMANLVTLGDTWLTSAIQQQLIQPLAIADQPGWQRLAPRWQALVQRDPTGRPVADGEIWGAPYRWGSLAIAYRTDRFQQLGWTPADWSDLWHPDLKGQISLPDDPRLVIGLALKRANQSLNTTALDQVTSLEADLTALHQQVKLYSSDAYLQPLLLEDTWLAVGWSTDFARLTQTDPRIAAFVPVSGTLLFADLWVQPATPAAPVTPTRRSPLPLGRPTPPPDHRAAEAALAQAWIDYCWQPDSALQLSLLTPAVSPVVTSDRANLPTNLASNALLLPSEAILERSEFLAPLEEATAQQYQRLWQKIRLSG